jgi:hypothetical protein
MCVGCSTFKVLSSLPMRKLTKSERAVIERLIFPEPFDVIMEETKMQFGELRDDLMNLVNYRYVEVVNIDEDTDSKMLFYDSDKIKEFSFRATKIGLKSLNQSVI